MNQLLLDSNYGTENQILGPCSFIVPFVACGNLSGFDSDKSYPLQLEGEDEEYVFREPVQPPIRPNYHSFQQLKNNDVAVTNDKNA